MRIIDFNRLYKGEKIGFKNEEVNGYITKKVHKLSISDEIYYAIVLFDRNGSKWDMHILSKDDNDAICTYYPSARAYISCGYPVEERIIGITVNTIFDAVMNGTWDYHKSNNTPPPVFNDDTITFIKEAIKELQNEYRKGK